MSQNQGHGSPDVGTSSSGQGPNAVTARFSNQGHELWVPQVSILRAGKAQIYAVTVLALLRKLLTRGNSFAQRSSRDWLHSHPCNAPRIHFYNRKNASFMDNRFAHLRNVP